MLNSIYRALNRRSSSSASVINVIYPACNVRLSQFSSVAKTSISETADKESLMVNYLINTFGFSNEKAYAASKYLKIDSTEKPDLFIAFLKNRGLLENQIGGIVRNYPPIILCDVEKSLLPKIDYFLSSGISQTEVNNIFLHSPGTFRRSLETQIMPSFKFIKRLFDSTGTSFGFTKRVAEVLRCDLESQLIPNIKILSKAGVPNSKIVVLLQYQARSLMVAPEKFREIVEDVKKMNFDPCRLRFILAVHAFRAMSKSTWEKKVAVYKKWGLSENDIISVFQTHPYFMMISTDKIMAVMNILVNEMGLDFSFVVKKPDTISYSLEKRINPRCSIYKVLLANGLIKNIANINSIFRCKEIDFLRKYVKPFEKEAPGLLRIYQKELAASKS